MELQILGVELAPGTLERLKQQEQELGEGRKRKKALTKREQCFDDDGGFCEFECSEWGPTEPQTSRMSIAEIQPRRRSSKPVVRLTKVVREVFDDDEELPF